VEYQYSIVCRCVASLMTCQKGTLLGVFPGRTYGRERAISGKSFQHLMNVDFVALSRISDFSRNRYNFARFWALISLKPAQIHGKCQCGIIKRKSLHPYCRWSYVPSCWSHVKRMKLKYDVTSIPSMEPSR